MVNAVYCKQYTEHKHTKWVKRSFSRLNTRKNEPPLSFKVLFSF